MTHELSLQGGDGPDVEQLLEYRDLAVSIVRGQGKGIRYARFGERATTRPGTEYMLPGAMTEWSPLDRKYRTRINRERRYSASFRQELGGQAGRLLVLESDSVRDGLSYDTKRNIYRFSWVNGTVHEAEVLPIQIISGVQTDVEVVFKDPYGVQELMLADHERTMAGTAADAPGYFRYVNPWRDTETPWKQVSAADFDGLLARTDEFGRDILAGIQRDVA